MPIEGAVPFELVAPVVSVLSGAVIYQTKRLWEVTKRMEQLYDEDRDRSERIEAEYLAERKARIAAEQKLAKLGRAKRPRNGGSNERTA